MSDQHNDEEYVLVPRSRLKLSRMRKGIIGALLVGTLAALTSTGTFASFSASTSNDATFVATRLALQNQTATNTCISPAGVATGTGAIDSTIDVNDASGCGSLFPTAVVAGVNVTATVDVKNIGDNPGDLFLFAPSACTVTFKSATYDTGSGSHGTNGALCGQVHFTVSNGTSCLYPTGYGATCPTLGQSSTTDSTFQNFASTATFGAKITAATALGVSTTKNFSIGLYMTKTTGCTADGDTDTSPLDGFTDTKGIGCDNKYQNEKAVMFLRWLMQA